MADDLYFESWAVRGMEREGLTPEEYCNEHQYNMDDIIAEPDSDD